MEINNDNKLIKLYNILIVINLVIFASVTLVMLFAIPFSSLKLQIWITIAVIAVLILILTVVDIVIIKKCAKKWSVK